MACPMSVAGGIRVTVPMPIAPVSPQTPIVGNLGVRQETPDFDVVPEMDKPELTIQFRNFRRLFPQRVETRFPFGEEGIQPLLCLDDAFTKALRLCSHFVKKL